MNNREFIRELLNLSDEALVELGRQGMTGDGRKVAEHYANGGEVEIKAISEPGKWLLAFVLDFDSPSECYRAKRKMIRVNGVEVPAPETEVPAHGTTYYMPNMDNIRDTPYCIRTSWHNCNAYLQRLSDGLVYLNKEDAEARARAMLKFEVVE